MNPEQQAERAAREQVARAERALQRAPDAVREQVGLARAWLELGEVLQQRGQSIQAQDCYRFGLRLAERLHRNESAEPELFVDALMHAASVAPAVLADATEATPDGAVPDSLPPDPDEGVGLSAGCRSIIAFQMVLASSYSASPGCSRGPRS